MVRADLRGVWANTRPFAFPVFVGLICAFLVAFSSSLGLDYVSITQQAVERLGHGQFAAYFGEQAQMGQLSIVVRVPGVWITDDPLMLYRVGAFLCLTASVALAVTISRGTSPATTLGICVALIANPVTIRALELGHPEEMLGAALCAAAMLAAIGEHRVHAGILLGLALATKQWAILAVLPVLLVLGRERWYRTAVVAAGVAAAFTLAPLLMNPGAFVDSMRNPVNGVIELRPGNVWSLVLGPETRISLGGRDTTTFTNVPGWLRLLAHPSVALICFAAAVGADRYRSRRGDAFLVLALVFLIRCVLDPWNHEYYHAPFLAALCCWEVVVARRAPVVTILSTLVLWVVFTELKGTSGSSTAADVVYLSWAAVIFAGIARAIRNPVDGAATQRNVLRRRLPAAR